MNCMSIHTCQRNWNPTGKVKPKELSCYIAQWKVLAPGSVLYLPRGVWHQTEAGKLSVSLNITYNIPTVLDVVLTHIKQDLVQYEIMHENVDTTLPREA